MTTLTRRGSDRRSAKAARRGAISGSGPMPDGGAPGRNPGAIGAFSLFGEVLLVGVLVTVAALPIVTLPAALAAAIRHLRRFVAAEGSGIGLFGRDLLLALRGGVVVGVAVAVAAGVLAADIVVAGAGALPGGQAYVVLGWLGLAVLGVVVLGGAAAWTPESGWIQALRTLPATVRADPAGATYLVATVGFVGFLTWVLPPLLIPALGCAALAAVAIPERPRRDA